MSEKTDETASKVASKLEDLTRKRPELVGVAIVVVLLILAGLGIYFYLRSRKKEEAKKE